jgi:hypothetical protein
LEQAITGSARRELRSLDPKALSTSVQQNQQRAPSQSLLFQVSIGGAAVVPAKAVRRLDSKLPSALYGRGFAKLKTGDRAGGNADITAAKKIEQNVAAEFARYGLN